MTKAMMSASPLAVAAAMLWSYAAAAQQAEIAPPDATADEIVVTGSRIARSGYQAPTPLTVLSTADINAAAPANVADFVNRIPSVVGSSTPANSQLNMSEGTFGVNSINLRRLGANRTLVLLDGQRSVGSTVTGLVDVNTFPQGLIKSVEVVTGGASAAYGSDAVTGVVNFILDKQFTGLKGNAEYGLSTYGDAPNYRVGLTAGTAFAEGRGHIVLSGEIAIKEGLNGVPRKWNENGWYVIDNPDYAAGNGKPQRLLASGIGLSTGTPGGLITDTALKGIYFDVGGAVRHFNYGTVSDPWMIGGDWQYTQVNDNQSLDPAQNRKNVFGRLSYEIAPWFNLFAQGSYARSLDRGQLGIQRNLGNVMIRADNPYIPAGVLADMKRLGITSFLLGTTNADLPIRTNEVLRKVQRYVVGADGAFPLFGRTARWDAYYQKGIADTREAGIGISNNARLTLATDAVRAPAGNALGVAAGTIVCRSTLTAPGNGCVPFNRLGIGVADPAAVVWVTGNPYRNQRFQQDVFAANLSFDAVTLPAGAISVALGGEHHREQVTGEVEAQYQTGWFTGNYRPTNGRYNVTEGYLELLVPIIKGLDVNGAVRATDYSTSGYVTTWKAGVTFDPIPGLRLRATRSRDIRAPNLGELFASGTTRINELIDSSQNNASVPFAGTTRGNPNLKPEKADQWGVGVVLQPHFLPNFALSVDYYDIKINGAIGSVDAQTIVDRCNEGVQAFCAAVARGPNSFNNNLQVFESPFNFATQRAQGIDFETSWRVALGTGNLTLRGMATYYIKNLANNGIDAPVDSAGSNASDGTPSWIYRATATYANGPLTLNLIGRGISAGVYDTSFVECTSGCPASTVTNRTINDNRIGGAFYIDATAAHDFTLGKATMQLFFNITNLFDKDPPVVGYGPGGSAYAIPSTNQSFYDLLGRTFRVGVRFKM